MAVLRGGWGRGRLCLGFSSQIFAMIQMFRALKEVEDSAKEKDTTI